MDSLAKLGIIFILLASTACVSILPQADTKLRNKEYHEAITLYQQHLAENSGDYETRGKLGFAYLKTGRFDDAINEFEAVLAKEPGHPRAILYLGQTYLNTREYKKARQTWAIKRDKQDKKVEAELQHQRSLLLIEESQKAAKDALKNEATISAAKPAANTIAVCYYSDLSNDKSLKPFQKGLTSMVTTYLAGIKSIKVIERERLQALLSEMRLGMTGIVDQKTAPRVGRLLGVETLVVGSLAKGSIEAISTLSSSTKEKITGSTTVKVEQDKFFELATVITRDIVNIMGIELTAAEQKRIDQPFTKNYKAFVYYGQALDAVDDGNWEKAKDLFEKAFKLDDAFTMAKQGILTSQGGGNEDDYMMFSPLTIMNSMMQPGGQMGIQKED